MPFWDVNGAVQSVTFCLAFSLNVMSTGFIHVVYLISNWFVFIAQQYSIV